MLLLIILVAFYIMHVHFMLKNIFWGVSGANFFSYYIPYRFSREVALDALVLGVSCAVAFVIGYIISNCKLDKRFAKSGGKAISEKYLNKAIRFLNILLALQIGFGLYIFSVAGLNYSAMFNLKMSMSFIFESRMLALVLLGFVLLNKPAKTWLKEKRFNFTTKLLFLYFIISLFMQSRSVVFEFGTVIGFCWLMWQGNKIKIKYIVILLCTMVIPNLMVLPRFGGVLDLKTIISGIFSFEYTVLLSNIVSAAIDSSYPHLVVDFILRIPALLIPSPIRNAIGLGITQGIGGDYFSNVFADAGVYGGGFSMLAELYMNLGWWAILWFVLLGFLIGKFIKGASRVGRVNLLYAIAPLIYASFLINLRNDFGTFAKYSIQLILVAIILKFILRIRWIPLAGSTNVGHRVERIDDTTVNDSHIGATTGISPEHSVERVRKR